MATVYKTMDEDIKAFKVMKVVGGRIKPAPEITDITSYDHFWWQLHHYIKAQSYKRNKKWYDNNGIEEKLILMPVLMHQHLEDPIYGLDEVGFYKRWGIRKELLLFNKKKWIEQQVKGENYGTT